MLPKCVLPSNKRGRKGRKLPDINRLCDRWAAGERATLWAEAVQHSTILKSRKVEPPSDRARVAAAISLAEDGL